MAASIHGHIYTVIFQGCPWTVYWVRLQGIYWSVQQVLYMFKSEASRKSGKSVECSKNQFCVTCGWLYYFAGIKHPPRKHEEYNEVQMVLTRSMNIIPAKINSSLTSDFFKLKQYMPCIITEPSPICMTPWWLVGPQFHADPYLHKFVCPKEMWTKLVWKVDMALMTFLPQVIHSNWCNSVNNATCIGWHL